jgi:hypothetical protein
MPANIDASEQTTIMHKPSSSMDLIVGRATSEGLFDF